MCYNKLMLTKRFSAKCKRIIAAIGVGIMATSCFTACGKGEGREIVLSTGFYEDEIFRLEGERCNEGEVMVYLTNIMNQYSQTFGEEIWDVEMGTTSLEAELKETVLARIVKIKIMNLMAEKYGLSLSSEEEAAAESAASTYYHSLSPEELSAFGQISEEEIARMYKEYAMAGRLYTYITKDVNTEISDDEARSVIVEQIVIYKDKNDTSEVPEAAARIAKFASMAREEGADFTELASLYNEAEENRISVLRGQYAEGMENVIFSLDKDQISEIVETGEAYYLFYCISPVDYNRIDSAKEEIITLRKQTLFNETYDSFAQSVRVYLNESTWNELVPIYGGNVDTCDFFAIFDRYSSEK